MISYKINIFKLKFVSIGKNVFYVVFARHLETEFSDLRQIFCRWVTYIVCHQEGQLKVRFCQQQCDFSYQSKQDLYLHRDVSSVVPYHWDDRNPGYSYQRSLGTAALLESWHCSQTNVKTLTTMQTSQQDTQTSNSNKLTHYSLCPCIHYSIISPPSRQASCAI